jgi:hypothetical protein
MREIEEESEPNSFNFNMFEVNWAESLSTEAEWEEEEEGAKEGTEEKDERSTRLDFTKVETKEKLRVTSLPSASSVVDGEETSENEVEGIFDKISAFVWGMEDEKELDGSFESTFETVDEVESEAEDEEAEENESGRILVRNIEFTESTGLWPTTSWPATNSVKLFNKVNKSTGGEMEEEEGEEVDDDDDDEEEEEEPSRTWINPTEFNELNMFADNDSWDTSNDWAWFNDTDNTSNTESLESRDNSDGERVTDDNEDSTDNTPPSLTSLSSEATLSSPSTIWERICRRFDISDEDMPQSSPEYSESQKHVASHTLSNKPHDETLSPDSKFTNWHVPWPEQSGTLQLLLFIAHTPDTQLSQPAQLELESQLINEADTLLSKLDSSTHNELSSPLTPK